MPTTSPVRVSGSSPARCATPKSASLATPAAERGRVGDDHVLGLDVAVHDAAPVRVLERAAQREADPQHVAVAQHALGAELVERAAVDELGDQVARPSVLAGVEDGDHPGMVEAARGQRLAAAALAAVAARPG